MILFASVTVATAVEEVADCIGASGAEAHPSKSAVHPHRIFFGQAYAFTFGNSSSACGLVLRSLEICRDYLMAPVPADTC